MLPDRLTGSANSSDLSPFSEYARVMSALLNSFLQSFLHRSEVRLWSSAFFNLSTSVADNVCRVQLAVLVTHSGKKQPRLTDTKTNVANVFLIKQTPMIGSYIFRTVSPKIEQMSLLAPPSSCNPFRF